MNLRFFIFFIAIAVSSCIPNQESENEFLPRHFEIESEVTSNLLNKVNAVISEVNSDSVRLFQVAIKSDTVVVKTLLSSYIDKLIQNNHDDERRIFLYLVKSKAEVGYANNVKTKFLESKSYMADSIAKAQFGIGIDSLFGSLKENIYDSIPTIMLAQSKVYK